MRKTSLFEQGLFCLIIKNCSDHSEGKDCNWVSMKFNWNIDSLHDEKSLSPFFAIVGCLSGIAFGFESATKATLQPNSPATGARVSITNALEKLFSSEKRAIWLFSMRALAQNEVTSLAPLHSRRAWLLMVAQVSELREQQQRKTPLKFDLLELIKMPRPGRLTEWVSELGVDRINNSGRTRTRQL